METTFPDLVFTKYLDVKSPKIGTSKSVGTDLYIPKFNDDLVAAFEKVNKGLEIVRINTTEAIGYDGTHKVFEYTKVDGIQMYIIYRPLTIPTGIGIDLPDGYFADVRGRSSNLNNAYTVVLGTVDEDYTYGMGAQVFPIIPGMPVCLVEEERVCQVVIQKAEYLPWHEMTQENFEKLATVNDKRESRTGGFGHTGKN